MMMLSLLSRLSVRHRCRCCPSSLGGFCTGCYLSGSCVGFCNCRGCCCLGSIAGGGTASARSVSGSPSAGSVGGGAGRDLRPGTGRLCRLLHSRLCSLLLRRLLSSSPALLGGGHGGEDEVLDEHEPVRILLLLLLPGRFPHVLLLGSLLHIFLFGRRLFSSFVLLSCLFHAVLVVGVAAHDPLGLGEQVAKVSGEEKNQDFFKMRLSQIAVYYLLVIAVVQIVGPLLLPVVVLGVLLVEA